MLATGIIACNGFVLWVFMSERCLSHQTLVQHAPMAHSKLSKCFLLILFKIFYMINLFWFVFITNRMEDDDSLCLFEIWHVDDCRVNGKWRKIAKIGPIQGIGQRCFGKTMRVLIFLAEDDGCGAVTIYVSKN